jgi:hypothetical protein
MGTCRQEQKELFSHKKKEEDQKELERYAMAGAALASAAVRSFHRGGWVKRA